MNLIERLKDIPKGTKLYSPIFGEVELSEVDSVFIYIKHDDCIARFHSDGKYTKNGECMLFPSRDNRDWSNYKLFKAGDFIVRDYIGNKYIGIFSHVGHQYSENAVNCHCSYHCNSHTLTIKPGISLGDYNKCRIATDEEKALLLGVINKKGYVWNECTLSIDRIHKFDINTFNPFDRVLARDDDNSEWYCEFYSHYRNNTSYYKYACTSSAFYQCIPYNDDTKHLVGTKENCSDYYKTWE